LAKISRYLRAAFFCAVWGLAAAAVAANAAVTDVSGRTYNVASARLLKGGLPLIGGGRMQVVCGETRMSVPFGKVRNIKIDPAQISPVDGRPYFGVEIQMRDGTVIGDIQERGRCLIYSDNGLRGKSAKAASFSAPFSSLSNIQILGKGDGAQAQSKDGEEDDDE
jgi:hypothetical protein